VVAPRWRTLRLESRRREAAGSFCWVRLGMAHGMTFPFRLGGDGWIPRIPKKYQ